MLCPMSGRAFWLSNKERRDDKMIECPTCRESFSKEFKDGKVNHYYDRGLFPQYPKYPFHTSRKESHA